MAPRPEPDYVPIPTIPSVPVGVVAPLVVSEVLETPEKAKIPEEEEKEVVRDEIFARMEYPFGLEQHHFNWIWLTTAHVFGIWYCFLLAGGYIEQRTFIFELLYGVIGGMGITVGCHRYWTHKTFKANKPLQYLMMVMQTSCAQYPIHKWSLDHRIHHKYTDTNSDPHNSERGLLFSHIGWLYLPKHPDLQKKLKTFEMKDLESDPVVRFQSRYYWTLLFIFHTAIPVAILHFYIGLPLIYAVACNYRRYIVSLNFTWCVNSIAHVWGDKPYDKNISSVDSRIVSFLAIGEGWHNYHHTFPWDYKSAEFGWKMNLSTMFIDFFAAIGWASDMKTVSQKMLKQRLRRTGDGSHADAIEKEDETDEKDYSDDFEFHTPANVTEMMKGMDHPIWGWDDEKMTDEFRNVTRILNPEKKF